MPGDHLRMLTQAKGTVELGPDQTAPIRSPLPDRLESLATRACREGYAW